MPEPLPDELKIPEVSRFVKRADQLRAIKPAIAYWCEYHAVNQIVARSLHTSNDDCFAFTRTLLERLESTKAERADDDAIVDNTAGQAYVEQFAQQTFDRAERTLRANKVTRQTADTFDAAATFFDLGNVWGPPDAEALQKIKFAKWNAARILKALREGVDPNETNPKLAEQGEDLGDEAGVAAGAGLDPDDPDVRQITGAEEAPRPASVEDIPDAGEQYGAPAASLSPAQEREYQQPPAPPPGIHDGYFPPAPSGGPQGPQQPTQPSQNPETANAPFVPSPMSSSPAHTGQGPPPTAIDTSDGPGQLPPQLPPQPSPPGPSPSFHQPSGAPSWATTPGAPPSASSTHPPAISQPPGPAYPHPSHPAHPPPPPQAYQQPALPQPTASTPMAPMQNLSTAPAPYQDTNKAQKHAKFAISALNFDDIPTAISELKTALAHLGVQT